MVVASLEVAIDSKVVRVMFMVMGLIVMCILMIGNSKRLMLMKRRNISSVCLG